MTVALRRPRYSGNSLTAATSDIPLVTAESWGTFKFNTEQWQREAWRLYDIVGELRFLANWIGDSASQARLFVTELDDNGEETGEVEDPTISRLALGPLGTGDDRDDNLRLTGIDLAVGGEAFIIVVGGTGPEEPDKWFVVTTDQIRRLGDKTIINLSATGNSMSGREIVLDKEKDIVIRVWRPHPNAVDQADSPTRSAIPPLREVELITKREFAELDSRLTGAGVWPLPEGLDFPREKDDPEGIKGFMRYLQRAVAKSMKDQSSAAALVPHMFTVPDQFIEHLDKLKPITFWSELSGEIGTMKEKAIARIGNSFDIPTEILTGMAAANHWTSWAISEEGIKRIKPYLSVIAAALTRRWLRPALVKMGVENPDKFAYAFDVAPLAVRPNRQSDALELFKEGLLSAVETVKAGGFGDNQMPTPQEEIRSLILNSMRNAPSLLPQLLAIPAVQDLIGIDLDIGPARRAPPSEDEAPSLPPAEEEEQDIPDTLDDGPPDERPPGDAASLTAALDQKIATASLVTNPDYGTRAAVKLAVLRALELAGGRLVPPGDRRHRYAGVPRHELHTKIGQTTQARAEQVIKGAWEHLPVIASDLNMDAEMLRCQLNDYVTTLITRGMAHSDDMLDHVIRSVRHG